MKVSKIILGMGVCLALVSCSDLLGNKDLQHRNSEGGVVIKLDGDMTIDHPLPLFVVDGEIWKQKKVAADSLNPDNIKAIEVLRDEKAKKYGPMGQKNGVIIITTKKKARN